MNYLKVIIENTAFQTDIIAEHGLSFYLNVNNENILFDTGQSDALINNAKIFDIDLQKIDKIIISHGHYDHTGGLNALLEINTNAKVYLKKQAIEPKYSKVGDVERLINTPIIEAYKTHPSRFIFIDNDIALSDSLMVVANIPSVVDYENDDNHLFIKNENAFVKDSFEDELFLIVHNDISMSIITGCAHRGVINSIEKAKSIYPDKKINNVVGGFHLRNKTEERLHRVTNDLKRLTPGTLKICHCTGIEEYGFIKQHYHERADYLSTGKRVIL